MGSKRTAIVAAGIAVLSLSVPSFGHHGTSIVYDLTDSITISGVVTDFRFVNPHTLIHFDVSGDNGEVVEWLAGLSSNTNLSRTEGWTRDTLKPGDQITITGAPARGGAPSVWVVQVLLDGRPLLEGEYTG